MIRPLTMEDVPQLKGLLDRCRPYVSPHPDYNYWLFTKFANEYTMVNEIDGRLIGYLSGFAMGNRSEEIFVVQICVDPDYRGQGLGKELLETLYQKHNKDGRLIVHATICPSNEPSQNTFKSLAKAHKGTTKWLDSWFYYTEEIQEREFRVEIEN